MKSKEELDRLGIFSRILETLGAKNAPEAARILNISKQAVYDWQKSTPSIENLLRISRSTNTSLHWILTGEGQRPIDARQTVTIEDAIDARIRKIVREELGLAAAGESNLRGSLTPVEEMIRPRPVEIDWDTPEQEGTVEQKKRVG